MEAARNAEAVRWAVSRLSSRLRAQQSGGELPLTRVAASVLANLRHGGPLTVTALAAIEGLQPQSLTRVLHTLTAEGRVSRSPDDHDRRAQRLAITSAGRAALDVHVRDGNRWLAGAMDAALTPAEREIVRVAAGLLLQVAEHDGDGEGDGDDDGDAAGRG
ncbi:MarR family winged helix-turn-helix transcriptional regulator [Amycolatopsis sp. H20-H5]|uniref:MarR family winged helix-turn-helix transcriptional regulator n=1 Tax=Amycolatopsis sp. H20-H5 TaxID=3046309 RepID=UPI002DB58881|nr:MarR family transcriptional regulator [Amycolatopsis sp. H20-H5]MEC3978462.1 MarR family transcriptional regulator [Amycolatopsis sp. H20-H5]